MSKVTISFSLDDGDDADLLRWLDQFDRRDRSQGIRRALRDHIDRRGVTLGQVYQLVQRLETRLEDLRGQEVHLAPPTAADNNIPDDIAASLSRLGL